MTQTCVMKQREILSTHGFPLNIKKDPRYGVVEIGVVELKIVPTDDIAFPGP